MATIARLSWHVSDLVNINLKRAGIYVMLGKSKRKSIKYVKFLYNLNRLNCGDLLRRESV